ncbi:hypothetical protein DYB25_013290 [Aphanomyces astaci]|uniref:Uncharacterized protein n=1 Tax=Aphanomyces astaci TaxID=112090 RepID=A0A397A2K3_APHAT|nr:hypothetical protein DYB25_013290 [Aphanomyces astaci]
MLHEQPSYQQQLESLVLKKPRFMERSIAIQMSLDSHTHLHDQVMKLQDDSWRVLQLGAGGEKRLTAIHAIADRQLDSVDSDMLTCGLVDMFAKCDSFQ